MKRQTAVDWLVKELHNEMIERGQFSDFEWVFEKLIQQAKQMERQQIIDAWCDASPPHEDITLWAEEYYNRNHESTNSA